LKQDAIARQEKNEKKHAWHGKLGRVVYDGALLAVLSGMLQTVGVLHVGAVVVVVLLALLWITVNFQLSEPKTGQPGESHDLVAFTFDAHRSHMDR
jgi:hypothetical protein